MPSSQKTQKNAARSKRVPLPRRSGYTRQFEKDWQSLSHSGKHDMSRLRDAMTLIVENDGPLPPEWLDHSLDGDWAHHRELHAKGDLLLIYRLSDDGKDVVFVRAGTHSELFGR